MPNSLFTCNFTSPGVADPPIRTPFKTLCILASSLNCIIIFWLRLCILIVTIQQHNIIMNVVNDIFNEIEEYEATHNMLDFTAPDEPEDIEFSPLEYAELEHLGNKLPPLMPGRTMTTSMLNFAVGVTKAYRLCYAQFFHFIDNAITLSPDEIGYITRENVNTFLHKLFLSRLLHMKLIVIMCLLYKGMPNVGRSVSILLWTL